MERNGTEVGPVALILLRLNDPGPTQLIAIIDGLLMKMPKNVQATFFLFSVESSKTESK